MLRWLVIPVIVLLPLMGNEQEYLSPEKQTLFLQQQKEIDSRHEKLRYDWISPLMLKASTTYNRSASTTMRDRRDSVSAGISQDLFRSGGITYAIDYADAQYHTEQLGLLKDIASTRQQLTNAVLTCRKYVLLLNQSDIKLENLGIEIFLKRKQYEAGDIDITLLNNALMNQSNEQKNNAMLQMNIEYYELETAKLSSRPVRDISLPTYTLIQKENFMEENWDIRYTKAASESAAQQYGIVKSSYEPKLTFLANTGLQRYDQRETNAMDYNGHFYDAGLQLTFPLTYNASEAKQEAQASYLKRQSEYADKKRQSDAYYKQILTKIENYRRLITITQKNLVYYDELLRATRSAVETGYKAGYDLKTLENTRIIELFDVWINELNIQIELANLHFMTQSSQGSL